MIEHILIISLSVIFILYTAEKWGLITYYENHRKKWMPEYCQWCFSFWLCLISSVIIHISLDASILVSLLLIPASVTLTRVIDGVIQRYL